MKRIVFLFLLAFLIPITDVNGYYCKFSEISKYKSLASNITTFYEYEENENGVTFSITLVNLSEELYIVDATTGEVYQYGNSEMTISGYSPSTTVKYAVYTTNENCSDQLLYTIRVVLPDYNPYYKDDVCIGAADYLYCQKWYKHNLDYDTFVEKVNDYKKVEVIEPVIDPVIGDEYGLIDAIVDILAEYYYVVLIAIIIICGTIIYITDKKSNVYW